jgi:hypothetical protein
MSNIKEPSVMQVKTWIDCMRHKTEDPEEKVLINDAAVKRILNYFGTIQNLADYMKKHDLK